VFVGANAGLSTSSGTNNAILGSSAGENNVTGDDNTFIGDSAGQTSTSSGNTYVGAQAGLGLNAAAEANNTFLGRLATGASGVFNATAIGSQAFVSTANSLVLGSINGTNGATADTKVGIRTTTPHSILHGNGSFALSLRVISAASTLGINDYTVVSTAAAGVPTLPTAVGITGRMYVLKNRSGSTITPATTSGQTIDGTAPAALVNNGLLIVQSDGGNWVKLN
jgi:hypothetical protein